MSKWFHVRSTCFQTVVGPVWHATRSAFHGLDVRKEEHGPSPAQKLVEAPQMRPSVATSSWTFCGCLFSKPRLTLQEPRDLQNLLEKSAKSTDRAVSVMSLPGTLKHAELPYQLEFQQELACPLHCSRKSHM